MTRRTHNTIVSELDLTRKYARQGAAKFPLKPVGLWYGIDDEWLEWCKGNMEDWVRPNDFEIEIRESRICLLDTYAKITAFSHGYRTKQYGITQIDWEGVTKNYSGIEINPYDCYDLRFHLDFMWYYGWDCASGCIWDLSVIEEVKKL